MLLCVVVFVACVVLFGVCLSCDCVVCWVCFANVVCSLWFRLVLALLCDGVALVLLGLCAGFRWVMALFCYGGFGVCVLFLFCV